MQIKGFSGDSEDVRGLDLVPELGEDILEKEMTTHSSTLAWEIPWTEEPGGLYSLWCLKSQIRLSD